MTQLETAYRAEIEAFRQARADQDAADAWHYLERAHILSQQVLRLHLHAHAVMLTFAISRREWREARGQVLRLVLAPFGALLGGIPLGNTGRASVSAFVPMPIPEELRHVLGQEQRK
ncbi:DUF3703 domain-containing protein [Novosphingobium sp.]|uniref:DUF3703 domain-containing protein n=1 Tax=Novosphingobium sp. TaxID=1874826 RepID=UPI002FDABFF2